MSEKVALVTGASRGIGKAIALELARAGMHVAVNFAGNRESAEAVAAQIRDMGRKSITVQADVANAAAVEAMFQEVEQQLGPVLILVNNAGITRDNLLLRMKEAEWDQVLDTNLKGVFLCTKQALRPMMKARWGRIINITSVSGVMGNPGTGQLFRGESRRHRLDENDGPGSGQPRHHGERGGAGIHRDGHDGGLGRGDAPAARSANSVGPLWTSFRSGEPGAFFGLRRKFVHHRASDSRGRRHGHVNGAWLFGRASRIIPKEGGEENVRSGDF